jgi:hypothetical protein
LQSVRGGGEASVGERIVQPLSLVTIYTLGADAVAKAEGNTYGHDYLAPTQGERGFSLIQAFSGVLGPVKSW